MLSNLLYISATSSLLVGSILTFEIDELASYFYLIGTSLFFLKASLHLTREIRNNSGVTVYGTIN